MKRLSAVDEGIYLDRIYNTTKAGDWAPEFDMLTWWTGGTPDPGFLIGMETSDNIGYWGVTYWARRGAYDALWYEQATTIDREARRTCRQAQQRLYDQTPLIPLAYQRVLQAYRSDDWTGWVRSPANGGVILTWYNNETYVNVHPIVASAENGTSSSSWVLPVVLGIVGVVVVVGAVVLLRRRGRQRVEES